MSSTQPLAGVTVLEIGHSVAAPYAGMVLAELGARVIKVEHPGRGDDARGWGPPFTGSTATAFEAINRNKLGITVDLKDAGDQARLLALIDAEVDVVLHNLKPGALERLGLGAEALRARKPSLIYCCVGAFGSQGPLAGRPGYDPLMQAFSGLMSLLGEDGRPPVRIGVSAIDMTSGMWASIGILAALRERELTGRGGVVDTSLCETALALMATPLANYLASGRLPARMGSAHPTIVPTQAFPTADGYIMVAVGNDAQFTRFAEALGEPDLAFDPRFATNPQRVLNRGELVGRIESRMRQAPTQQWAERLDRAEVPNGPIHTLDTVVRHPQTEALQMIQPSPDQQVRLLGLPVSFDGERPALRRRAPDLGEHNEQLLGSGLARD